MPSAAEKVVRVQESETEVRVGDRGRVAAEAVARRSRLRSGTCRPDPEESQLVHRGDAAAPGADFDHLQHRSADGQSAAADEAVGVSDLELAGPAGLASLDDADLGRRASHVEGDEVPVPRQPAQVRRRHGAAGRTGLDEPHRVLDGGGARDGASVGGHDHGIRCDPFGPEACRQIVQVATDDRSDVGVGDGGARAFELPDVGAHVAGERDRDVRSQALERRRDGALVRRVPECVQQTYRDRLDAVGCEAADEGCDFGLVQRRDHAAPRVDALGHLEDPRAANQGLGELDPDVVDVVPALAAHGQDVPKAAGHQQRGVDAAPLDEGVGRERGAVHDGIHVARRDAALGEDGPQPAHDASRDVAVVGQDLGNGQPAAIAIGEGEIRERAADVDSDSESRCAGAIGRFRHPSRHRSRRAPPAA